MTTLQLAAMAAYGGIVMWTLSKMYWSELLRVRKVQHLLFGSTVSVSTLWLFRAGIYEGLNVHFLWLSALVLTLGFRLSIMAATIALLAVTAIGKESWGMLGVNGIIGVVLPIGLTYAIFSLTFHRLPKHVFVYIFVCAFIPGAIMIATKMYLLGAYYAIDGIHSWNIVRDNYTVLVPLLLFPEAMLNGMTMTLLIIYKPDWVYTFADKFYIDNK